MNHAVGGLLLFLVFTAEPAAASTYWNVFNTEGENLASAEIVTYATFADMLGDVNRLNVSTMPGLAGANVVDSGSDGITYWNVFNLEGETAFAAEIATYSSLVDMLADTNRIQVVAMPGLAGRNLVGSGSDGETYWNLFNYEEEDAITAEIATYGSLSDMLNDSNRLAVDAMPGLSGRNIVGSGSNGGMYWIVFNLEGEGDIPADIAHYDSLADMLSDSNRLDVITSPPPAGRNIVGSGAVVSRAQFRVAKDFTDDLGTSVTMSLACSSGRVSPPVEVSEGNPGMLEVTGFETAPEGNTSCTVTESGLPAGYYQKSATEDCAVDVVEHEGQYLGCVIENAPFRSTFETTKDFSDDNPAEVLVTISCNTGLPLQQSIPITEEGGGVTFVVTDFEPGALMCSVSEVAPAGYEPMYVAEGGTPSSDPDGCHFSGVEGGDENRCEIINTLLPVDLVINKQWIDEHPEYQLPTWAEILVSCNAPIFTSEQATSNSGVYELEFHISPTWPGLVSVLPSWDGSTVCSVSETPEPGVLQDTSDCEGIALTTGAGGECTIVNSRLYAGVPALDRHGFALLVLFLLGFGVVAIRRLA